jgi:type VI secretion system secreted protein Hcp
MRGRHRSQLAAVGTALAVAASITYSGAALNTYLTLTGEVQGAIRGSVTLAGRLDTIEISEVHHLIHRPVSGGIVGAQTHEPFIFTKRIDRSTVNLYRALNTGERLTAIFRYYAVDSVGAEIQHYTIELRGALIVAIEPIKADNLDAQTSARPDTERVRMVYQEITVRYQVEDNEAEALRAG